ncbi:MAG: tRNA uridine-5-carboxymethylaminomethyl(34) synthesis enzyme MnmG [Candidatus Cloacimonetes bacterium]|nr:tRNA uridine-5-carboxymethylaminomethyl(34) synthesis enzyme MnmG [Candidatus Cloacimonadota bacterium]MBS3767483.1 tRNA uridine-5-carboxymethylaminomethyl(34) synthesis enzyme MnmG [Candidatus Cloacimonadota bacterium]
MKCKYDVIVVGGGHAGCEAAITAAKRGAKTLMFIIKLETIGRMSCNPAVGGLAKGHLVREIDAMGGTIGKAIDKAGIHFRMLNKSKGPAVWAPRAQADRMKYQLVMRSYTEQQDNLDIKEALIQDILVKDGQIQSVQTQYGQKYFAKKVIIAAGTFLKGKIHIGMNNYAAGRAGEFAANKLSESLQKNGLQLVRFKTGTPPRLDIRTLNTDELIVQEPDEPPTKFSYYTDIKPKNYVNCYLTKTNPETHKIISNNIQRSSLFSGNITGVGARYCPSIEDKIKKFPQKDSHQVFLEPEGTDTYEVYANGIPTSFPPEIQYKIVHSIKGLENAKFMRYGYAIEYDCIKTSEIKLSLETKKIKGLYLAGQINGTSGYEEAAAQGMVAAINAVNSLEGKEPVIFYRDNSYIGVLIDDIVTKGVDEPYRMFTARAEYRLYLRQDNADERLMPLGYKLGMVSDKRYKRFKNTITIKKRILNEIKEKNAKTDSDKSYKLIDLLKRPEIDFDDLKKYGYKPSEHISDLIKNKIELEVKYKGYIKRQMKEIEKFKSLEHKKIPLDLDFMELNNISYEAREKMNRISPVSVGQASRIPGVTYSDVSALLIHLKSLNE